MRRTDLDFIGALRELELSGMLEFLPPSGRILDFGAGPGHQAKRLAQLGFDVEAVDVESSAYARELVFPVKFYDGRLLPFPDHCFDAVFSSNVLPQIRDLAGALADLTRVLGPGGVMLHVMSSASWRFWTSLAEFPAAPRNAVRGLRYGPWGRWARAGISRRRWMLMQLGWIVRPWLFRPHGVRGSAVTELWTFSRRAWARRFAMLGYEVTHSVPLRIWYTGEMLLGAQLSLVRRSWLSTWLGSSATLYVIRRCPSGT
jgi:SAM-dependent methyltransferase